MTVIHFCFSLKKENAGFLSEFWEVLAGPPELFDDVDDVDSESSSDNDGDGWSDDDDDNGNPIVNADIEPVCVVM